jgi:hypothetical protein
MIRDDPAHPIDITVAELASIVGGCSKEASMNYLISHVAALNLVDRFEEESWLKSAEGGVYRLRLTFSGWTRFEELMHANVESRTAFMAMAFGDHAVDQVYADCLVPAVADAGFKLRRLDEWQVGKERA